MNKFTCLMAIFLLAAFSNGRDIYVSWDGTNNPPYTNWPDAATNIEWAVNVCNKNGDTIWISNGVYVLTNQIIITNNIIIRGTNGTPVIDGNNANRCFYFFPVASPLSATGTLINLFIARGRTNDPGGGLSMPYGTVRDCIFSNNVSSNNGGGVYTYGGSGVFQNCTFIDNRANNGGGIYSGYSLTPRYDNCSFRTNRANVGGGIYIVSDRIGYTVITGCDFVCNVATGSYCGGGFFSFTQPGSGIVAYCTFVSNICQDFGGGGYFTGSGGVCLSNSFFSNNIAVNSGGGVYADYPNTRVVNCVIARNRSTTATQVRGGGGLTLGVAAMAQSCIIEENQAGASGGGVLFVGNGCILRNCLIRNNVASGAAGLGGGLRLQLNTNLISSCTIASNYATGSGGGIYNDLAGTYTGMVENCIIYFNQSGDAVYSNYYNISTNSSWSNNCFAPAMADVYTAYSTNNITNNPQFVDQASGNYRLKGYSPCVNAGVNRDWMINAFDLDGRIRIRYGIVDMGAYEAICEGTIFKF